MSIAPIGFPSPFAAVGDPAAAAAIGGPAAAAGAAAAPNESFATMLTEGLQNVQGLQDNADGLAVKAASGDLKDIHSYTIAATQAQLATELTVAIRNKAVEAFTEIMRMPV